MFLVRRENRALMHMGRGVRAQSAERRKRKTAEKERGRDRKKRASSRRWRRAQKSEVRVIHFQSNSRILLGGCSLNPSTTTADQGKPGEREAGDEAHHGVMTRLAPDDG